MVMRAAILPATMALAVLPLTFLLGLGPALLQGFPLGKEVVPLLAKL